MTVSVPVEWLTEYVQLLVDARDFSHDLDERDKAAINQRLREVQEVIPA